MTRLPRTVASSPVVFRRYSGPSFSTFLSLRLPQFQLHSRTRSKLHFFSIHFAGLASSHAPSLGLNNFDLRLIGVKTFTALFSQPSGVHHFDQYRTWPVLGIA